MKKILITGLSAMLLFCFANLSLAQGSINAEEQKATSLDFVIISMEMEKITENLSYAQGYIAPLEKDLKIDVIKKMDLKMLEKTKTGLLILKNYCNINEELIEVISSNNKLKKIEPFEFFTSYMDDLISDKKIEAKHLKATLDLSLHNIQEQIEILKLKKKTNQDRNWVERQLNVDF